jgi:hypothetical protein
VTFASTNFIDSCWQKIKSQVPKGLEVKSLGGIRTKMLYVRSAQWRMMTKGEDKWKAFCEASIRWRHYKDSRGDAPCDEPGIGNDDIEDEGAACAGSESVVPFGFVATGEAELLKQEKCRRGSVKDDFKASPLHEIGATDGWDVRSDASSSDESIAAFNDDSGCFFADGAEDATMLSSNASSAGSSDTEAKLKCSGRKRPAEDPADEKRKQDEILWGDRYWEQQEQMKCGRHAVNNLMGGPQFIDGDLEAAGEAVCIDTGEPRKLHIAANGWYSLEVLARLLDMTNPPVGQLLLRPCNAGAYSAICNGEQYRGCLVNLRNRHWVCIVPHNGHVFYVDSLHAPVTITEDDFGSILDKFPMTFLVERHSDT